MAKSYCPRDGNCEFCDKNNDVPVCFAPYGYCNKPLDKSKPPGGEKK